MQDWKSGSGIIAVVLWAAILLSGAIGCGITREVTLPIGYICNVDDMIWITHPDEDWDVVINIEVLDVQNGIVFGSRRDWITNEFLGYFIIETELQEAWFTWDEAAWRVELSNMGIDELNLRWPGVNFNGPSLWQIVVPTLIAIAVIVFLVRVSRQFGMHQRQLRQDRPDRL